MGFIVLPLTRLAAQRRVQFGDWDIGTILTQPDIGGNLGPELFFNVAWAPVFAKAIREWDTHKDRPAGCNMDWKDDVEGARLPDLPGAQVTIPDA